LQTPPSVPPVTLDSTKKRQLKQAHSKRARIIGAQAAGLQCILPNKIAQVLI